MCDFQCCFVTYRVRWVTSSLGVRLPVLMFWLPVLISDFQCWCMFASVYVWLPVLMWGVLMSICLCCFVTSSANVWSPVLMCDCQCWCESLGVLMSFCLCFWRMIDSSDVWLRCRCKIASADVSFLYLDVRLWVCVDVWFEYSLCVNYVCACCVRARCLTKRIPAAASLTFQNIRVKASLPHPLLPFPC